jgi:hypothetical protein
MRYILISTDGDCKVYNIIECAKMYQKIYGGVIKEVSVAFE